MPILNAVAQAPHIDAETADRRRQAIYKATPKAEQAPGKSVDTDNTPYPARLIQEAACICSRQGPITLDYKDKNFTLRPCCQQHFSGGWDGGDYYLPNYPNNNNRQRLFVYEKGTQLPLTETAWRLTRWPRLYLLPPKNADALLRKCDDSTLDKILAGCGLNWHPSKNLVTNWPEGENGTRGLVLTIWRLVLHVHSDDPRKDYASTHPNSSLSGTSICTGNNNFPEGEAAGLRLARYIALFEHQTNYESLMTPPEFWTQAPLYEVTFTPFGAWTGKSVTIQASNLPKNFGLFASCRQAQQRFSHSLPLLPRLMTPQALETVENDPVCALCPLHCPHKSNEERSWLLDDNGGLITFPAIAGNAVHSDRSTINALRILFLSLYARQNAITEPPTANPAIRTALAAIPSAVEQRSFITIMLNIPPNLWRNVTARSHSTGQVGLLWSAPCTEMRNPAPIDRPIAQLVPTTNIRPLGRVVHASYLKRPFSGIRSCL